MWNYLLKCPKASNEFILKEVSEVYLRKKNKGQSILEYALLLGIVVSGILIMQTFVKRGFQGSLKDSADKMGEQFSAHGTTTSYDRKMTSNQVIADEIGTKAATAITDLVPDDVEVTGVVEKGAYAYNKRTGGNATVDQKSKTDSAANEKFKYGEHQTETVENFPAPF